MTVWDLFGAVLAILIAAALAFFVRWAIRKIGRREDTVTSTVEMMARIVFVAIVLVGVYIGLRILDVDLIGAVAGAGVVGIAVAFALKDIASNYISGILLGFRHPFRGGDEIVSGEHEGEVEDLNLRYTTIRTLDGDRVFIPNTQVLTKPLINRTVSGTRRSDFTIGVDYGTDLDAAQAAFIGAVRAVDGVDADQPVHA